MEDIFSTLSIVAFALICILMVYVLLSLRREGEETLKYSCVYTVFDKKYPSCANLVKKINEIWYVD